MDTTATLKDVLKCLRGARKHLLKANWHNHRAACLMASKASGIKLVKG